MNFLPELQNNTDFIETSLSTLKQECPTAYNKMCQLLTPREIAMEIDSEVMHLVFAADNVSMTRDPGSAPVRFQTTQPTILNLVDAHTTFNEAVLDGRIQLFGQINDIADFYEGFLLYLHGAVRCPSFPALLEQFRQLAAPPVG